MPLIYETANFRILAHEQPLVDRDEGGHIKIEPIVTVEDRTQLTPELAKELMKLTMVCGEAMATVMTAHGVDIGRINYLDMGNWIPHLYVHVFGRAKSATRQKFGEALHLPRRESGFYEGFKPLSAEDIRDLVAEIERLMETEKYRRF